MRIFFAIVMLLHGLIHIMGFAKAFSLAEISALTMKIPRFWGVVWAMAALLLAVTAVLWLSGAKSWWVWAFIAAFLSQVLILWFWKDAKYGTIINVLVFVVATVYYLRYDFHNRTQVIVEQVTAAQPTSSRPAVLEADLNRLPTNVQLWLRQAGVLGQAPIQRIQSKQNYQMRLKPDQEDWHDGNAEQVAWMFEPAFVWDIDLSMMPLVFVTGRDFFQHGEGAMKMKVMGLVSVADVSGNSKVNQGTLQRFLAETAWYPSFALSEYVEWSSSSPETATATMDYGGTTGSCAFHFGPDGLPMAVTAMRFRGGDEDAVLTEWRVELSAYARAEGYNIPHKAELSWQLEDGRWTWARLEVTDYRVVHGE